MSNILQQVSNLNSIILPTEMAIVLNVTIEDVAQIVGITAVLAKIWRVIPVNQYKQNLKT
jgi:hypothetical protein